MHKFNISDSQKQGAKFLENGK